MNFFKKYLKYKEKYLNLKSQSGGMRGGPGSKSWNKSTASAPSKPVVPQHPCKDDNEQRVINCKLILEDQHGNFFMGANGINITSSKNKATVGLLKDKSIQQVLDNIYQRVKYNNNLELSSTELKKFEQETKFNKDSTIDKIIADKGGNAIREQPGDQIYPAGGGGSGSRVITRSIIEREQFIKENIISKYPKEYNYVIEKGLKLKIIQPPPKTLFKSYLGGARDGEQMDSQDNCLTMRWEESTDDCLRREVLEEANVDLAALCLNWATTPKPNRPPIAVDDVLYFDRYESDRNNCCTKYYYLKISDTLKPHFLSAYTMITGDKATEFFNGDFRHPSGGSTSEP